MGLGDKMKRIFGFDIGTTSIGFAVINHDLDTGTGQILEGGLGVRIFPEARDPDGTPLNQQRRTKRMMRRQLRRRKRRRRELNETLAGAGLLPAFNKDKDSQWAEIMRVDPYQLRQRALSEALSPHEVGRALYHLAKRRHFKGRDLESDEAITETPDEQAAKSEREGTLAALRRGGVTLGSYLAAKQADATTGKPPSERRRGIHASRAVVEQEFERIWDAQSRHHPQLKDKVLRSSIEQTIFFQRPVFWRTNTLGKCRLVPGDPLCPKGSWLSGQRRMLEKLNNLAIAGGNQRPLDDEERAVILEKLQTQTSMTWGGVRRALASLYGVRGEKGAEKSLKFNLELSQDKEDSRALPGNAVEAKLAGIFGEKWESHPHKQAIREGTERLRQADYGETPDGKRIIILPEAERQRRRAAVAQSFISEFGIGAEEAEKLKDISFPTGWEPFSWEALRIFLPELEKGVRMGVLLAAPEKEGWRNAHFPNRHQPTGEILDLLPSPRADRRATPAQREESKRIAALRNPTVVRIQNELRKVVNNLVRVYGRPDLIRVEVARTVGKSKRKREDDLARNRKRERERKAATADLQSKGLQEPSRADIEKWLLWKESQERCPYTGDHIGFDALFRHGEYEVEHIWPRWRSLDDSFANKTLCRKDVNQEKGARTPFEAFSHDGARWAIIRDNLSRLAASKSGPGLPPGKIRRFLATNIPEDFVARQLNDTSYAARQAVAFLKRLWPDVEVKGSSVNVLPVTGRITAELRRLWGLNNILSNDGEKTRADHRHHAIDALVVACTHPGMTQKLSRYWQEKEEKQGSKPQLPPPWPTIRADGEKAREKIVISHRVRKKISGPLHEDTTYGDTREEELRDRITYRKFVTRKPVSQLTPKEIENICDVNIREIIREHVEQNGGKAEKAFPPYPRLGVAGPEIRKVRIYKERQPSLMTATRTGHVAKGNNHHIAIYRLPSGRADFEVVSLFDAVQRLRKREPVVRVKHKNGMQFVMSISLGDTIHIPDGDRQGCWVARILSPNGQVYFHRVEDAVGLSKWGPNPNTLLQLGARKISVDPIGRIRPARD